MKGARFHMVPKVEESSRSILGLNEKLALTEKIPLKQQIKNIK